MMSDKMGSKEVRDLKAAQWEGFRRLASKLPNHQVLAVELVRTYRDETAAILTVVRDGEPVRYVVRADAQGRVKPQRECEPRRAAMAMDASETSDASDASDASQTSETEDLVAAAAPSQGDGSDDGDQSPDFAFGRPPVDQPPTPGVVAFASAQLAAAFNAGEFIALSD